MPKVAAAVAMSLIVIASAVRLEGIASGRQTSACTPPAPAAARQTNIFSDAQENDLGDVLDEWIGREFRIVEDETVTKYLVDVGARVVAHLPPNKIHFQFFLVDLADANAMSFPGGRIYVSRKLIALTKSEDELAGVIGHEAGHIIARQGSARLSRQFKDVLGVTSVGDRADIREKVNSLFDNIARKPGAARSNADDEQVEADLMGIYAVSAAGYDPQAHTRFMDRLMGTKGDTGGFFSNLFGTTSADSVRLRDLIKNTQALPAACVETRPAGQKDSYEQWQAAVVGYTGFGRKEALHDVVSRTQLTPPLNSTVSVLRFSPDGRMVLALDDSGISVLSREPFKILFRIYQPDAANAQFSADSRSVWLHTDDMRVERWDVATHRLAEAHEVFVRRTCDQISLAPEGKTIACFGHDRTLSLLDVATGDVLFEKKAFVFPDYIWWAIAQVRSASPDVGLLSMGFSTDGRFFAAAARSVVMGESDAVVAYDVQARAPLTIPPEVKKLIAGGFVFTGADRLIAHNWRDDKQSSVISLPTFAVGDAVSLFGGRYQAATHGDFVFVRPFQKFAVGVMDLTKRVVSKGLPNPAIDVFGEQFVAERGTGEVGLYGLDNRMAAAVTLPRTGLSRLRAVAVSPDFRWLAVSSRGHGGVWSLDKGASVTETRSFRQAAFTSSDELLADFPANGEEERKMMHIDLKQQKPPVGTPITEGSVRLSGPYVLVQSPAKKGVSIDDALKIDVRDAATNAELWTKTFNTEPPVIFGSLRTPDTIVLAWSMASPTARALVKSDPVLSKRPMPSRPQESDGFLQVVDMKTGTIRGQMWLDTGAGSFDLGSMSVTGDTLSVTDQGNRVHFYSVAAGGIAKGRVFGFSPAINAASHLLAVSNGAGKLTVYGLDLLDKRDEFTFGAGVTMVQFSQDGTKLFVLTSDQSTFVIDLTADAKRR